MGEYCKEDSKTLQGNDLTQLIPIPERIDTPKSYIPWDMKHYMMEIEATIAKSTREIGVGRTSQERAVLRKVLAERLIDLSLELADDINISGDFNIAFMHCMGMLCTAWSTFITDAKSINPAYPKAGMRMMHHIAHNQLRDYRALLKESLRLGDKYNKESRWGVPNVVFTTYYYCTQCRREIPSEYIGFDDRTPYHIFEHVFQTGWFKKKTNIHAIRHDLEARQHVED